MKAILEFNLDDHDDRESYERINPKFSSYDVLDMVFEEIGLMLQDEGIDIDKLIS